VDGTSDARVSWEGGVKASGDLFADLMDLCRMGGLLKGTVRCEEETDDGGEGESDRGALGGGIAGSSIGLCNRVKSSSSFVDTFVLVGLRTVVSCTSTGLATGL